MPAIDATIPEVTNKLNIVDGVADNIFGTGVTQRDLLALLVLTNLRIIEGQKGNAAPGLLQLAATVGDVVNLANELNAPAP